MEKESQIVLNILDSSSFDTDLNRKSIIANSKNNKTSEKFRKQGNLVFNNQLHNSSSHEEIWKLYSRSVASAEGGSEELALAYANRSAILLHMSKYEASLMDVDRALNITNNTCLQIKLLMRKAKCLHALRSDESEIALKKAESLLEKIEVEDLNKMFVNDITETKFMLENPVESSESTYNSTKKRNAIKMLNEWHVINDFSSIEIQHDEENGRHLIATKDIRPGQVIYVEKPYVHCVNSENTHLYCYHCLSTSWANIPCEHCSWAMFCSETCKKEAWGQYHSIECSLYSGTKQSLDDNSAQLAVKALCRALKKFDSIESLKTYLSDLDECKENNKGFIKNGKIRTSGFKTMYVLSNDISKFKMQKHKESTSLFLNTLSKTNELLTEEFQGKYVSSSEIKKNVVFLGALFLKLSTATEINKLEMWNGSYKCPNDSVLKLHCCKNECCSKGVYIAPVTSLLNHSCNPNVNVCYSDNHKTVLYALQPIKKGEQIFRCYQDEYFLLEKSIRKRLLNNTYNFECKCLACQNDWPSLLLQQDVTKTILSPNSSAEVVLQSQYERIIDSAFDGTANHNEKLIGFLRRELEKALKESPQPALGSADLMRVLSIVFNQLYGIMLFVPSECNSEIKFV